MYCLYVSEKLKEIKTSATRNAKVALTLDVILKN